MQQKFMDENAIKEQLRAEGLNPLTKKETSRLMISEKVIRCETDDLMVVGMGSDRRKDDQIQLIVDAVHLCLESGKNSLRIILGKQKDDKKQREVENAVALMIESIKIDGFKIETEVDGEKTDLEPKSFFRVHGRDKIGQWMMELNSREGIPKPADELEKEINDKNFKWYRSVTTKYWSGRVGGLEVCRFSLDGKDFTFDVGKPGKQEKNSEARQAFLDICARNNIEPGSFSQSQFKEVASAIRAVAESRRNGVLNQFEREHLMESQVLSSELEIVSKSGVLEPVCAEHPFQFPALWEPSAEPRYIDALMSIEDIPYIVELKEGHSPGEYYRHGITQAVLYREFIKRAVKLHLWFKIKGLDPWKCRAAVAFPELAKDNKKHQRLLDQHKKVAECFDVEIIKIRGFKRTS